jgi:hypothetical protein
MTEFLAEAATNRKAADTLEAQIEAILLDHSPDDFVRDDNEYGQTWGDQIRTKQSTAKERSRRALRFDSWANVIRDLLSQQQATK